VSRDAGTEPPLPRAAPAPEGEAAPPGGWPLLYALVLAALAADVLFCLWLSRR
jgi:hypothetical protein